MARNGTGGGGSTTGGGGGVTWRRRMRFSGGACLRGDPFMWLCDGRPSRCALPITDPRVTPSWRAIALTDNSSPFHNCFNRAIRSSVQGMLRQVYVYVFRLIGAEVAVSRWLSTSSVITDPNCAQYVNQEFVISLLRRMPQSESGACFPARANCRCITV